MKQYIGSKIVQAEPAYRFTGVKPDYKAPGQIGNEETIALLEDSGWEITDKEDGYEVVYEDGYQSWSPKEVFEAAYRQTDGMSFGLALEACKMGKRIARKGWNGKGQYVELGVNFSYYDASGICEETHHQDIGSAALVFCGTRGRQVGWLASQADMLADDWMIQE